MFQPPGVELTREWMSGANQPNSDDDEDDVEHHRSGSSACDDSPDNTHPQSSNAATSRSSLNKFCNMVLTFNEHKKSLVRSIGFGGMLEIPRIKKLNNKLSVWLMQQVNCQEAVLRISESRSVRLCAEDVHAVFGIPLGDKAICGPDAFISQYAINLLQASIGMSDKLAHSLRAVDSVLRTEITSESSASEQEAFKIAFVVFAMGTVLTPCAKHNYVNVNFWGALQRSVDIPNFNWAAHVLTAVIDGAKKVQSDIARKSSVANISGCHLFLQVLYLDNLDLGHLKLEAYPMNSHVAGLSLLPTPYIRFPTPPLENASAVAL